MTTATQLLSWANSKIGTLIPTPGVSFATKNSCSLFTSSGYEENHIPVPSEISPAWQAGWFENAGRYDAKPEVGDQVFVDLMGQGRQVFHTGFVTQVNADGSVETIENNAGAHDGHPNGVFPNHRGPVGDGYTLGFGHPPYVATQPVPTPVATSVGRCPFAVWKGPVSNKNPGAMQKPIMGLVLHIEQGYESGTDSEFHNPNAHASSHFGNPKTGPLDQWVDVDDEAWAEMAGNSRWISVEHEGFSGDSLTPSQLDNDARLLVWLHDTYGVPVQITDDVNMGGLGWHGMGGDAWGSHPQCPGAPIVNQRPQILTRALALTNTQESDVPAPTDKIRALKNPNGPGFYQLQPDGGIITRDGAPFPPPPYWALRSDGAIYHFPYKGNWNYVGLPPETKQGTGYISDFGWD